MVRLFNISIQGNTISCDYTPEASDDIGRVTMNMVTFEVIDINFSDYEYGKKMYASHVRAKLEELITSTEPLPNEAVAIWH